MGTIDGRRKWLKRRSHPRASPKQHPQARDLRARAKLSSAPPLPENRGSVRAWAYAAVKARHSAQASFKTKPQSPGTIIRSQRLRCHLPGEQGARRSLRRRPALSPGRILQSCDRIPIPRAENLLRRGHRPRRPCNRNTWASPPRRPAQK